MKVGPKFLYDESRLEEIISYVTFAKGSLGQVADLLEVHRDTFYGWVRKGDEDNQNCTVSPFSKLSRKLRKEQATVIMQMVDQALKNPRKAKFTQWWLSKICREDFGTENEEIKQLKDLVFNHLIPLLGKGETHARKAEEVDTESSE